MANNQNEKAPKVTSKSFMAVGPTLHYSHKNVQRCWLLAVVAFGLTCLFWSRIVTGSFWSFDLDAPLSALNWRLDQSIVTGVSIFEYPWQILVLGILMGIMAVVPLLVSQLLSFRYSLLLIVEVLLLANLPGLALCLLVSCVAVACRPLRFRSRFIAIALCTAPQLLYWGFLGSARDVEPVKWGFSFAPWICAWLVGLIIAAVVLGIGHYTRYRPGLVWVCTSLVVVAAIAVFEAKIGFDELDYQLYVAENIPGDVTEFHDHRITEALDRTLSDPTVRRYLEGFFYPSEPIPLRQELKEEIQIQLSYDRWPSWFIVPSELQYRQKKQWLSQQYDRFINPARPWWMPLFLYEKFIQRRSTSKRMALALYCKALLSEYSPDLKMLEEKEILHFYSDYPHERSRETWHILYRDFGTSPESAEARWRIAKHWAGLGRFEQAGSVLAEVDPMVTKRLQVLREEQSPNGTFFSPFQPPPDSVMTESKLTDLRRRMNQLRLLISPENRTGKPAVEQRLAEFVMLNPHSLDYSWHLDKLLQKTDGEDPLRDNVLLAKTKLIADEQLRAERLKDLHEEFQGTDGAMQALYELGLLRRRQWSQQDDANVEFKKKLLAETRAILTSFVSLYPQSIYAEQVQSNLSSLPTVE